MDSFYIIGLTTATVLLIVILTYIGIQMQTSSDTAPYPPIAATCPDYWTLNSKGYCMIPSQDSTAKNYTSLYKKDEIILTPKNTPGLQLSSDSTRGSIDFKDKGWSSLGSSPTCAQKAWSNTNKIHWDGVSNFNSC